MENTKFGSMGKKTASSLAYSMHFYATQIDMAMLAINHPELRDEYFAQTGTTPEKRLAHVALTLREIAPCPAPDDCIDDTFAARMFSRYINKEQADEN